MAATSRHWADIDVWIRKVISSCETQIQLHHTRKLVRNFEKLGIIPEDLNLITIMTLRSCIDVRFYYLVDKEKKEAKQ